MCIRDRTVTFDDTITAGTIWSVVGGGVPEGLLPTNYIYSIAGANVLGFLVGWDTAEADITNVDGTAITAGTLLTSGNTIEFRDLSNGVSSVYEYTGADYGFGANTNSVHSST